MSKDKIVERVRKLLALSNSPNEHEAQLAAERAQALLAQYNLSMSEVDQEQKLEVDLDAQADWTDSRPWRRVIYTAVARLYLCQYFFEHQYIPAAKKCGYKRFDAHFFVGAPHNTPVARMMAEYLSKTVDQLAREHSRALPTKERGSYENAFRHSAALRLALRIKDRIEQTKRDGTVVEGTNLPALASLYDEAARINRAFLDQLLGDGLVAGRSGSVGHAQGIKDGDRAGSGIGLDTQVRGDGSRLMLD